MPFSPTRFPDEPNLISLLQELYWHDNGKPPNKDSLAQARKTFRNAISKARQGAVK